MPVEKTTMVSHAMKASAWTVGTRVGTKLIDLAMLLCLARYLGPSEFGLVAIAMAAVFIVEALFELPTAAALLRVPALTPDMLNTAFTLSLLRGLVIALLLCAVSWPLAAFNNEPKLTSLLAVLALAPALRGMVSPRMVEFARVMNFRPDAAMELSGKAVAFLVSVFIAITTHSYWAIAAATVCSPLVATLLSYCIAPLQPRLTLVDWKRFSNLVGWNFATQLCSALNWQIDRLLLPRLTTAASFGHYAMGKQLSEIPTQALIQPLSRPTMVAMVSAGNDLASRYLQLSHGLVLVMLPVLGIPLLWPEALVRLALGPAWLPAAEWLRWISAVAMIGLPATLMGSLAMTLDRTRWLAVRTLIELLIRLPLVWLGAVKFGIAGAIAGSAIATASGTVSALLIVRLLAKIKLTDQLKTLWVPVLCLIPSGLILYLSHRLVTEAESLLGLLGLALLFGLAYLVLYVLLVVSAWWLMGKRSGLERRLFEASCDFFARRRGHTSFASAQGRSRSQEPMEAHGNHIQ